MKKQLNLLYVENIYVWAYREAVSTEVLMLTN